MPWITASFVSYASILTNLAVAQVPAATGNPATTSCTLHVWAQPYVDNSISGIFPGGVAAELENGPYREKLKRGDTSVTKLLLTPELLLEAVKESQLGPRLRVSLDSFVLERDNKTQKLFYRTKRTASDRCSYGLDFNIIQFQKSLVYGRRLIIVPRFFNASVPGKPHVSVWSNVQKLSEFDPRADDKQIAAVLKDGVRRALDDVASKKFSGLR